MFNAPLPESNILQTILQPLLDDFQYWFARSRQLLESEVLAFLEPQQQADLLQRVCEAQQKVSATQALLQATGGSAIVEMPVVMEWHRLVGECWQVAIQYRANQAEFQASRNEETRLE